MIITGNFQISSSHLSLGRDVTLPSSPSSRDVGAFKALSAAIHSSSSGTSRSKGTNETLAIIQLSHSGRQSLRFLGGRMGTFLQPLSSSSRRVGDDTTEGFLAKVVYWVSFQKPRALSRQGIENVVQGFVDAARLASETGFDGVQLHAAHGCNMPHFDY